MAFTTRKDCALEASSSTSGRQEPAGPLQGLQTWLSGRRAAPFASLGNAALTPAPAKQASCCGGTPAVAAAKEPRTGIEFPAAYCHRTNSDCPTLSGLGVRSKRIAGVKNLDVYALGFYVDAPAAKKQLGHGVRGTKPSQQVIQELIAADGIEKTIRLVISSGMVNQKRFWSALEERLAPELQKAGDPAVLAQFGALFNGVSWRKGLDISFSTERDGSLSTAIDSRQVGTIKSPALTRALLNIYLGPDPVSPGAKESISQGLAAILSE